MNNLAPPLTSLKVLSSEILHFFHLHMSNAGNHCRTGASSSSWVQLRQASQLHGVMADSGPTGGCAELSLWICPVKA